MSLANFKISEGLNIKGLVLDNNSGTLTWDGDNIATEGYVTTAIGNISIPPAYITSVGSNLSVTDGELNVDFTGLATETYVGSQGFLVSADLSGYALTADLNGVITGYNYITSSGQYIQSVDSNFTVTANELTLNGTISVSEIDVAGSGDFTVTGNANIVLSPAGGSNAYIGSTTSGNEIATQTYVGNQGFLVSSDLSGYLTSSDASSTYQTQSGLDTAVSGLGYITSSALSGYATETYVGSQGFITTSGQYIQSVGSNLSVTSNELNVDLTSKQDALTAGTYITITGSTIDVDTTTIATKSYVDGVAQGLNVKNSVRFATIASLPGNAFTSNTGGGSILTALGVDTATLVAGDRVLVKDQAGGYVNGIYTVTDTGEGSWLFTRAADEGSPAKGDFVFVEEGPNAAQGWILSNNDSDYVWTQFSAAGEYTAGSNITISGNSIAVSDAPTFNNPTLTVGSEVVQDAAGNPAHYFDLLAGCATAAGGVLTFDTSYQPFGYGASKLVITGAGASNGTYPAIDTTGQLCTFNVSGNSSFSISDLGSTSILTLYTGTSLTISSTEISYLDGVTSNIQTQLDAKQDTLASTTDVSVKTVTTQNADGVSSKVVAFGNITDTTYAMGSDVTVETLATATKASDIFLQILDDAGNSRTSKLTAIFNGGSAPIWTEYGVVDSGTIIDATVSFDGSKHIIVNVTGSGTYAVRGTATSLL